MNIAKHLFNWLTGQCFNLYMGGGGGGAPQQSTSTSYQTNIPEYAKPYVETMLGATQKQLFQGTPTAATYDKRGKEGKERPKFYKKMVLKDGLNLRQNYELFMSELLEKCKNEPQYDEYLKKYETSTIQEDIIVNTNNSIIHQTKDDSDAIKRRKPRKQ
jgi:signal recognition particle GTPase